MSVTAHPLSWPDGWPRTPAGKRQDSKNRFKRTGRWNSSQSPYWTFAEARDALAEELDRMGARNVVLSSNYETRLDGLPRSGGRIPDDRGVAVYFTLKGVQKVMACDMHVRAEENMRSIALALDAMRALERHGGGVMMERAFEGFTALPAPGARRSWREVFKVDGTLPTTVTGVESRYRALAKDRHPDSPGGSHDAMAELNAARDEALKAVRT
ncbi:J domain-containing protein [Mesorhizobium sp.]|uniref:J domain-containing protein n=1 Tax=Mesorhizobium sp. TaxID=1871066 RepID=UPI0011FC26FC|nr:J domain-containing protein [Mesorhizobium sp.]TIN80746.1 MAG: J domain-containing protein [Mesorhizobium sp.]